MSILTAIICLPLFQLAYYLAAAQHDRIGARIEQPSPQPGPYHETAIRGIKSSIERPSPCSPLQWQEDDRLVPPPPAPPPVERKHTIQRLPPPPAPPPVGRKHTIQRPQPPPPPPAPHVFDENAMGFYCFDNKRSTKAPPHSVSAPQENLEGMQIHCIKPNIAPPPCLPEQRDEENGVKDSNIKSNAAPPPCLLEPKEQLDGVQLLSPPPSPFNCLQRPPEKLNGLKNPALDLNRVAPSFCQPELNEQQDQVLLPPPPPPPPFAYKLRWPEQRKEIQNSVMNSGTAAPPPALTESNGQQDQVLLPPSAPPPPPFTYPLRSPKQRKEIGNSVMSSGSVAPPPCLTGSNEQQDQVLLPPPPPPPPSTYPLRSPEQRKETQNSGVNSGTAAPPSGLNESNRQQDGVLLPPPPPPPPSTYPLRSPEQRKEIRHSEMNSGTAAPPPCATLSNRQQDGIPLPPPPPPPPIAYPLRSPEQRKETHNPAIKSNTTLPPCPPGPKEQWGGVLHSPEASTARLPIMKIDKKPLKEKESITDGHALDLHSFDNARSVGEKESPSKLLEAPLHYPTVPSRNVSITTPNRAPPSWPPSPPRQLKEVKASQCGLAADINIRGTCETIDESFLYTKFGTSAMTTMDICAINITLGERHTEVSMVLEENNTYNAQGTANTFADVIFVESALTERFYGSGPISAY